jgi:hypothetical protein
MTFVMAALSIPIISALRAGEVSWQWLLLVVAGRVLLTLGIPAAAIPFQGRWHSTRARLPVFVTLVVLQLGGLASLVLLGARPPTRWS